MEDPASIHLNWTVSLKLTFFLTLSTSLATPLVHLGMIRVGPGENTCDMNSGDMWLNLLLLWSLCFSEIRFVLTCKDRRSWCKDCSRCLKQQGCLLIRIKKIKVSDFDHPIGFPLTWTFAAALLASLPDFVLVAFLLGQLRAVRPLVFARRLRSNRFIYRFIRLRALRHNHRLW